MKDIIVKVIRYDDKIAFQATYKAVNFADAIKQMENEYKIDRWLIHRIKCEDITNKRGL